MAYGIVDFSRVNVDYTAVGGVVYKKKMRKAEIGVWAGSPVAFSTGVPSLAGLKMAHIWAHASDGGTPAKILRKKFPINGNVAPPAPGVKSASQCDGVDWYADGYIGEKRREE